MSTSPLVRSYADSGVLVAGGTSGVGLATALGFVDAGVRKLVLLARNEQRGQAASAAVRDRCPDASVTFIPTDASDLGQVEKAVSAAHRAMGSVDVLVNSTTTAYRPELLHRTPPADIPHILLGQAVPPMLLTRAVLPLMQDQNGGSIINIASILGERVASAVAPYAISKAGVVQATKVMALELARHLIRVNALSPGYVVRT